MVQKWRVGVCVAGGLWLAAASFSRAPIQAAQSPTGVAATASQRAVFTQVPALTCHNERMKKAGTVPVALDARPCGTSLHTRRRGRRSS